MSNFAHRFNELFKQYLKLHLVSEGVIHPSKYPQFITGYKIFNGFYRGLNNYFLNESNFQSIKEIWDNNQEISFSCNLLGAHLLTIFERMNFDPDTVASFNPESEPFELCINFYKFNENFNRDLILLYLQSREFKILLGHELFHFLQTLTYGKDIMKVFVNKQNQSSENYQNSLAEIEACVFMTMLSAKEQNYKIEDFSQFLQYVNSFKDSFYTTAKNSILNNIPSAKDIFEHNIEFLTEALPEDQEVKFEIKGVTPTRRLKPLPPYKLNKQALIEMGIIPYEGKSVQISENK